MGARGPVAQDPPPLRLSTPPKASTVTDGRCPWTFTSTYQASSRRKAKCWPATRARGFRRVEMWRVGLYLPTNAMRTRPAMRSASITASRTVAMTSGDDTTAINHLNAMIVERFRAGSLVTGPPTRLNGAIHQRDKIGKPGTCSGAQNETFGATGTWMPVCVTDATCLLADGCNTRGRKRRKNAKSRVFVRRRYRGKRSRVFESEDTKSDDTCC